MASFVDLLLLMLVLMRMPAVSSIDNGLALTPPMGWLSWQRYRCNTDCKAYPMDCISEDLLKRQADCLVKEGYLAAGYQYITIDDCWLAETRDQQGRLQPDHSRFPNGIKALADYVHSKGLKLGIYEDFGTKTCAGFPGSEFYMQLDAQTFADWGIDLVKFDGCNSNPADALYGYPAFGLFLNKTGRPMLYSCEWPLYDLATKKPTNFTAVRETCNMWRVFGDIQDSWDSLTRVLGYYSDHGEEFREEAGPGGWNDPDMLLLGNFGLSYDQERTQMAMWAVLASPLIMSLDACQVHPWSQQILQNRRVIAVNQDRLGLQGKLILKVDNNLQIWSKPVLPKGSFAIAFLNLHSGGGPRKVTVPCTKLGLTNSGGYNVTETFDGQSLGVYKPQDDFTGWVNPSGVLLITAVLV